MKNNILNNEAADSIIARIKNLRVTNTAQWGTMNATEMLMHLNLCNEEVFEPALPVQKTTVKQYLLRIIALYLAPHFKKGVKGSISKETVGRISNSRFEEQKEKCIALIRRFPTHTSPITLPHIAFGNLSTPQWGIAVYKHVDHHLRQFGV